MGDQKVHSPANDINPQAPLHVLVVPRRHVSTLNDLEPGDDALIGEMVRRAAAIAADHGYGDRGYRMVLNCNADAGQSVFHIPCTCWAAAGWVGRRDSVGQPPFC